MRGFGRILRCTVAMLLLLAMLAGMGTVVSADQSASLLSKPFRKGARRSRRTGACFLFAHKTPHIFLYFCAKNGLNPEMKEV